MQHRGACLGIIVSCCMLVSPWARAETFALKTGERLEGTVVRAMGNTVSIRLDDRGMYQCPLSNLEWVSLTDRGGAVIQGTLEGWSDGTYLLGTDQGTVSIKDGQVIKEAALPKPSEAAPPAPPDAGLTRSLEPAPPKPAEAALPKPSEAAPAVASPEAPAAVSPQKLPEAAVTPNRPVM